jgi:hypothetical protein
MSRQQDSEQINERLAFFTLERIGHGVREVDTLPVFSMYWMRQEEGTIELRVILDAIFKSLSRFPHLLSLKCAHIMFSPGHLRHLSGSSSLETFTAVDCHIATPLAEHNAPITMVKDLTRTVSWGITAPDISVTWPRNSHRHWLSLMHPDFLRHLTLLLPLPSQLHRMLSDIVAHGAIYHSLRSLECFWRAAESPCFLEFLGWFCLFRPLSTLACVC